MSVFQTGRRSALHSAQTTAPQTESRLERWTARLNGKLHVTTTFSIDILSICILLGRPRIYIRMLAKARNPILDLTLSASELAPGLKLHARTCTQRHTRINKPVKASTS